MALSTVVLVVLIVLLVGALPSWPYSRRWGYGPAIALGLAIAVVVGLTISGRL